jgi:hypothetical protein
MTPADLSRWIRRSIAGLRPVSMLRTVNRRVELPMPFDHLSDPDETIGHRIGGPHLVHHLYLSMSSALAWPKRI